MDKKQAIEAIRNNWPDSRYSMLREALDIAIAAIEGSMVQKPATNSNYAAARDAHREWRANVCYYHGAVMNFEEWCEMRLNSDKPNCA